ncbi:flagellar biosynthesis protein [Sulfurivirga caldicuralii]|uniref:Flagellar biosynthetic protein FlhB n=1 Tax=Sulfurivirga caldicuralii TaxID=364032 RepID=A0A1N6F6A2_9GAMM|nr:EscU/YscU/HrcU family type III secretion system export apparatus switch protein [Sulfurivirga caldicuralii]SIN90822.1 flagellar biosynthesis protein [Sulfurivirga caldicuralii]
MSNRTDPDARKKAVALKYEGKGAPRVVAKGQGLIAQQIIELARQAGVPVQHDEALLALLSQIELDQEIPRELYEAVAQLLAFVYRIKQDTHSPKNN